jgi:hypothetical protein
MSLTPAMDEKTKRERREAIELCGKNRGPHDYMAIETRITETSARVTRLMCKVCFCHISVQILLENYPNLTFETQT